MVTECLVLRKPEMEYDDSRQDETSASAAMPPLPPLPCPSLPTPGLNSLIRALESSPPDADSLDDAAGDDSKSEATPNAGEGNAKAAAKASGTKQRKKRIRGGGRKKPAVSDDDDNSQGKTKKVKTNQPKPSPAEKSELAGGKHVVAVDDFITTIDEAIRERRIDEKKAERLHECLRAGDWSEVAFSLLCEQIPLKRKGKGYSCRVCLVPKKGHNCPYCHICSTREKKYKKDDDHVCVNCPACYENGKRKKKLIQVKREGHVCPLVASCA